MPKPILIKHKMVKVGDIVIFRNRWDYSVEMVSSVEPGVIWFSRNITQRPHLVMGDGCLHTESFKDHIKRGNLILTFGLTKPRKYISKHKFL